MMASLLISEIIALAARSQVERMTGIEPALSAWESAPFGAVCGLTWGAASPQVTVRHPRSPGLMAR
jgi:hypothetical protein